MGSTGEENEVLESAAVVMTMAEEVEVLRVGVL